jgi:hypothetical protein
MASSEDSTMAARRAAVSRPCTRSLMSRLIEEAPTISPRAFRTGDILSSIGISSPSFRRRMVWVWAMCSPREIRASIWRSSSCRSGGIRAKMEEPTISAAEYPKMRSAEAFQVRTVPSSFLLTMASSDDSTIAASRAAVSAI